MENLTPLLPLLVLLAALLARRGALTGSALGIGAVLAVIFIDDRYHLTAGQFISRDLPVVFILTCSVALVIIPGQMFNSMLQAAGTIRQIGERMQSMAMPRLRMASLIVLGVAPALEAMTGFGVSLFFTVPVLVQLFSLRVALLLSLISMNIMPWGTLALATVIGAQLSAQPTASLAAMTALTSFAVFPLIGLLIFFICRGDGDKIRGALHPLITGAVLSLSLLAHNTHTTELAGVYAGLTTTAVVLLHELARGGKQVLSRFVLARPPLLRLFAPYLLLIALIGVSRIGVFHDALQNLLRFDHAGVRLFVFTSPGVFIFISLLIVYVGARQYRHRHVFLAGVKRSVHPLVGIMLFVLFAQLHRASGIFRDLASRMIDLSLTDLTFIAPLIGMLSGYTTGSNVGGNALFMPLQSEIGDHFGHGLIFAALQNSAAGHAVFMSPPIILLTLSIAQGSARGAAAHAHQTWLTRRALLCAPLMYVALLAPVHWLLR